MNSFSQVLCFGGGCISLGVSLTLYLIFTIMGRNDTTATERIFATMPSILALVVAGFFFWLAFAEILMLA